MSQKPGALDFAGNRAWTKAVWAASEWDDVAAYIGPTAERYRRSWETMRDKVASGGAPSVLGFHWTALFFGFAWYFSRKMWAIGLLLLIVPLALGTVIDSTGAFIGITIAGAIIARSLYLQQATSRIAEVKAAGGGSAEIAAAGGISTVGLAIGGAILALAFAGAYLTLSGKVA